MIPGPFNDESEVQDDDEVDDEEGGPSRTKGLLTDAAKVVNEDQLQSFAATDSYAIAIPPGSWQRYMNEMLFDFLDPDPQRHPRGENLGVPLNLASSSGMHGMCVSLR